MKEAIVLGVVNGLNYALLAVGLVLVYKASKFVNFAHAQLGVLSAMVLGKLVLDWNWPYGVALLVAVAVGGLVGVAVDRMVVRPLADRSRTTLLVATIGVAQILLALSYIEALGPDPFAVAQRGFPVPFDTELHVGELVLRGQHVISLVAVPVVALSLAAGLRWSRLGKSIRAVASNADAARLAGISPHTISRVVWATAGVVSAVTAIVQAPSQTTFAAQSLGPALLLRALGAAACGGMTDLRLSFAAGVGLGVVEAITLHVTRDGGQAQLVVFVVILAAFLLRRTGTSAETRDRVQVDDRPARVPASVVDRWFVRRGRGLAVLVFGTVALALPWLPPFRPVGKQFLLAVTVSHALLALSLVVITGWAGQVSLGQFAFLGVGAYAATHLVPQGLSLPLVMAAGGGLGAVVAVVVGAPVLRRGDNLGLAVATLGFAVVAPEWLFRQPWLGNPDTITMPAPWMKGIGPLSTPRSVYLAGLVTLVLAMLAVSSLRRSHAGRRLLAVRDNEGAAAALGNPPVATRIAAFALAGFLAGVAGVVWAAAFRTVGIALFPPDLSLVALAMAIIGGIGSVAGAVLGAVVVFGIPSLLHDVVRSVFPNTLSFQLFLSGLGLVATQLRYPGGLAAAGREGWERIVARIAAELERRASATDDALLRVEEASVAFGGVTAVDHVTLEVRPGEIVGLIGTNGAGKSTLLGAISGAVALGGGEVRIESRRIDRLPPEVRAELGLARTFQSGRLFDGLTVREAVLLAACGQDGSGSVASLLGLPWARLGERRAAQEAEVLLVRFGLDRWADTPTAELSTGVRRICDLVCQLARRPKVLLLDEPTAGVAQREVEAFRPVLETIREELGCAILLVEHDMPLMMSLADRIYCMESGRVIAEGTPDEVRRDRAVVASYLGGDPTAIQRSGTSEGNGNGAAAQPGGRAARRRRPVSTRTRSD